MASIAILNYGMGNLRSVEKALERVGAQAEVTSDPPAARAADGLILPGVGAFPAAMQRVRELELDVLVAERVERRHAGAGHLPRPAAPVRAIDGAGGAEGLGLVPGEVTALEARGLKVPHIGWEPVRWERASELTDGLGNETPFYFVHSFGVRPAEPGRRARERRVGRTLRLRDPRPPLYGVQFHPEKSSAAGCGCSPASQQLRPAASLVAAAGSGPG